MAQDLYSGFSEGLTGGVSMALQLDQVKRQRQQDEWKQDMDFMEQGFKIAHTIKDKQIKASFLNQVGTIWNKRFPHIAMPKMTVDTVDEFAPVSAVIANSIKLAENPKKAKELGLTPERTMALGQAAMSNFLSKTEADAEEIKRYEKVFEWGMKPTEDLIKARVEQQKASIQSDSPSKIKAELLRRFLGGQSLSPQQEILIADDLADPLYKQAAQVYFNNPQNIVKKPDIQLSEIEKVVNALKQLQNQKLNQGTPLPTPTDNIDFKTLDDVKKASREGKIKAGDKIKVSGVKGIWYGE